MKVRVLVMPKRSVLDPQGVATAEALRHLGLTGTHSVRVGRCLELEVEDSVSPEALHAACRDLLSNPVVEDYELHLPESGA